MSTATLQRRPEADQLVDALQLAMGREAQVDCPLRHTFTPGLYSRQITMPADSLIISKIHRTEHQYVVSKGRALVWIDGEGWKLIEAGHHGVTLPGTRRVLWVLEETVWTTFHTTLEGETTVEDIEARIIEPRILDTSIPTLPTSDEFRKMLEESL